MNEVIFTSSSGDAVVSVNVWDSKTCTNLMTYKGGILNPKGLSLLGSDYVIGVEKSKPLLQVWPINSQQLLNSPRLLCPGKVSVMSCSPDSCYIAVGVDEKLHIYQVSSGCLVGSGVRHFQPITIIRWSYDSSLLSCGGEDGMVTVWSLSLLLSKESQQINSDPRYVFNDHSLPVTDLIITCGGSSSFRCRLISVSSDRTCKIYDLATGKILLSIIFTDVLTSVAVTPSEMEIFVGCISGAINQFSLRNQNNLNLPEIHMVTGLLNDELSVNNGFKGHKKMVTCLSVSMDGERLLSGSVDETVRVWHILSKQCLKVLNLKGQVTNAFFSNAPVKMMEQDVKRNIVLCPFQKIQTTSHEENNEYCLEIMNYDDINFSQFNINESDAINSSGKCNFISNEIINCSYSVKNEINRLRSANEKLYKISVERLLQKRITEFPDKGVNDKVLQKHLSNNNRSIDNIFNKIDCVQIQPALNSNKRKKRKMIPGKETSSLDKSHFSLKSNRAKLKQTKRREKQKFI